MTQRIFVFGSNLAGRHGAGSAKEAVQKHGAIYGQAEGLQGNSYAIPTKDKNFNTLSLERIKTYVQGFITFAWMHSEMEFDVVKIGCGLAGYKDHEIAPMFWNVPKNVHLPHGWIKLSDRDRKF